MLKLADKNFKVALVSMQDLKKNMILMSEEIENYNIEIESMFFKWELWNWKVQYINDKFIEWFQEQFRNAEEIVDKCEDKSIGII